MKNSPIPDPEALTNVGLFLRSVMLAKILYLNELYQKIIPLPGVIMEFGCWRGSNLALFQSLRAVYEPYNVLRKVIGFDTFEGYVAPGRHDTTAVSKGEYSVTTSYIEYLEAVLATSEKDNVQGHIRKFELVPGDVSRTAGEYFEQHPHTIVALAYLDVGLYEPTLAALKALLPHTIPGSVIAMDEMNNPDFPGETIAVREALEGRKYQIVRSAFLPDRTIIIL
jgi:hypothetical protein